MRIQFVCLGNICRSPLAHSLIETKIKEQSLNVQIDSSGIGNWHQGDKADKRMRQVAEEKGYNITHLAKQITLKDLEEYDFFFLMAEDVYHGLLSGFDPHRKYKSKYRYFKHYDPLCHSPNQEKDVLDPYHGSMEGFYKVFDLVDRTSNQIIEAIKNNKFPHQI